MIRSVHGAFLCLKHHFIEPFIELFRPNFYLSADGWGVGRLGLSIVTVVAADVFKKVKLEKKSMSNLVPLDNQAKTQ